MTTRTSCAVERLAARVRVAFEQSSPGSTLSEGLADRPQVESPALPPASNPATTAQRRRAHAPPRARPRRRTATPPTPRPPAADDSFFKRRLSPAANPPPAPSSERPTSPIGLTLTRANDSRALPFDLVSVIHFPRKGKTNHVYEFQLHRSSTRRARPCADPGRCPHRRHRHPLPR